MVFKVRVILVIILVIIFWVYVITELLKLTLPFASGRATWLQLVLQAGFILFIIIVPQDDAIIIYNWKVSIKNELWSETFQVEGSYLMTLWRLG
jgi:hypothetical protein